eukprot:3340412-Rhodomonas_salina.1
MTWVTCERPFLRLPLQPCLSLLPLLHHLPPDPETSCRSACERKRQRQSKGDAAEGGGSRGGAEGPWRAHQRGGGAPP